MKNAILNFAVDAMVFAAFVWLTSTGLLMLYVLPPRSGHFRMLWGMDRHEWGQLHFWIAVVLLAFLGLHLILHWKWIVSMVKGRSRKGAGIRECLAVAGVMILVGPAAMPFLGKVEQTGEPPHGMRPAETSESKGYHIDGSMTLTSVEQLTGISRAIILREVGLPSNLPVNERLGRVCRKHGLSLHDVREVVREQVEKNRAAGQGIASNDNPASFHGCQ